MTLLATQILMKANMIALLVGHTSTSVSLATGLCTRTDRFQEKKTSLLLSVTDRSAADWRLEGFNNASVLDSNLIIVINDNQMSIDETKAVFIAR